MGISLPPGLSGDKLHSGEGGAIRKDLGNSSLWFLMSLTLPRSFWSLPPPCPAQALRISGDPLSPCLSPLSQEAEEPVNLMASLSTLHPACTPGALGPMAQGVWMGGQWEHKVWAGISLSRLSVTPIPLQHFCLKWWTRDPSWTPSHWQQVRAQWHINVIFTALNKMLCLVSRKSPCDLSVPFKCVKMFAVQRGGFLS